MSKLVSSEPELKELVRRNRNMLVLFYAAWCPFSRMFLPVFEKQAATGEYCRVLTDELEGCADRFSIETVPAVLYFRDGKLARRLDAEPGAGLSEEQLTEMAAACGMSGGKREMAGARQAKKE